MHLKTFSPHTALHKFIKFYWILELDGQFNQPQRLLPSIYSDLIIHLGPHSDYMISNNNWETRKPVGFIEGLFKTFFLLRFNGESRLIGIRFKSTGLYPFLRISLEQITEQFVDLTDVFPKSGNELIERLTNETSENRIKILLDNFLLKQLNWADTKDSLDKAIKILICDCGMIPIHKLLKQIALSERQLEREFTYYIGISPEQFANRIRMKHFINLVYNSDNSTLTELAYKCGYFDQSHLIHTFKKYTGVTPKEYFCQNHPIQETLNRE